VHSQTIFSMVACPICSKNVRSRDINDHIDSGCQTHIDTESPPLTQVGISSQLITPSQKVGVASFFQTQTEKRNSIVTPRIEPNPTETYRIPESNGTPGTGTKRALGDGEEIMRKFGSDDSPEPLSKKARGSNALQKAAPLAERMRPRTLDEVCGQELVGEHGVLRGLIEADRVPSMILWGGAGTGKTTIARCISSMVGSRFIEINSTSTGIAEVKKLFAEARNELSLTGRKTIIFCDEIHRFSKTQQDVFLGPVESGLITLVGATTENPSFKVQNALMSRCRTFTLAKLTNEHIISILQRALAQETSEPPDLLDDDFLAYLAAFSDGDARTSLNLLELSISLAANPSTTLDSLKASLTQTLVYDRAGDQHYDSISALHKSIRGSNADATLYYLARMLQSGEDPLYIARRLIVVASEDVGLADNTLLSLATATYSACEKIGMPECRINLSHCALALCAAPKSTRAYRSLNNALAALKEPGVAGLPVPLHLRNAPTKLLKEIGAGAAYKYNPNYRHGRVVQEYLPDALRGRRFAETRDLGTEIDPGAWDEGELDV
jgi:putative ATPase